MVPTTDTPERTVTSASQFYDALALDYDAMTGFQKRFVQEKPFFRLLTEKYKIRTALDAGCGTGFHSLLLAQLGVETTGVDVSATMIQQARRHSEELSLPVSFIQAPIEELREKIGSKFDAVFSLGNTTAHFLTDDDLGAVFQSYYSILNPGGVLLLQNLNYDRILENKERLQSVKEVGSTTFVRFYDYTQDLVTFNILTITRESGDIRQSLKTIQLRPLRSDQIVAGLKDSGFDDIRLFGGITLDAYDPSKSKDLVVAARRESVA